MLTTQNFSYSFKTNDLMLLSSNPLCIRGWMINSKETNQQQQTANYLLHSFIIQLVITLSRLGLIVKNHKNGFMFASKYSPTTSAASSQRNVLDLSGWACVIREKMLQKISHQKECYITNLHLLTVIKYVYTTPFKNNTFLTVFSLINYSIFESCWLSCTGHRFIVQ